MLALSDAQPDDLDSILDYPTYFSLVPAFSSPQGNLSALIEIVLATQTSYKNGAVGLGSFLENHDQPRFQSMTTDQSVSLSIDSALERPMTISWPAR
jgi:alpha-amylase